MSTSSVSSSDFEIVEPTRTSYDTLQTAQRIIRDSRAVKGSHTREALVSLWDFAGQFVYYATHQLFFSPRCVYLLVINLDDDLDRTLQDWYFDIRGKQYIEVQGGVNFWLRSIFAYARGASPGVPPIFLVGTHKDKLPGDEFEKKRKAHKYFNKIRALFHGSPIQFNIAKESFVLDNTVNDPEIEVMKEVIIDTCKDLPYWGERVPAKWVELEQALEDRKREQKTYISLEELKLIDGNLAKPIKNEDQLKLFLRVQHENGTLVYFGDSPKLRDIIVLDPQWIINAFRYLIGAKDFSTKYGTLQNEWEDFIDTGRLKVQLAERIWKQDTENRFYENFDLLLMLLEKLDIIARARVIDNNGRTTRPLEFFYVPCLLKEKPSSKLFCIPKLPDRISTPVLCFTFNDNFLPPAIFNRVISICLGKWPIARQGRRSLLFCGCAVFEVNHKEGEDKHRMYIFFRKEKIGVRITRYTTKEARMVDPNICDQVRRTVATAVKKEFTRFHRDQLGSDEPFKFQIQCKRTNEKEVLEDGLHNIDDLFKAIDSDFFCTEHSNENDPHSAKPVEMLHEWFQDKLPEGFQLEGQSVLDTWLNKLPKGLKEKSIVSRTLSTLSTAIGKNWNALMETELGIKKQLIEHIQDDHPRSTKQQIYEALRTWKTDFEKKEERSPTNGELIDALRRCRGVSIDWELVRNIFDEFL